MKLLICGGREFSNREFAYSFLDKLVAERGPPYMIIQGGARGADRIGADWAHSRLFFVLTFEADWKAHGRAAGALRNQRMIEEKPDLVVAFPGSTGTADMIRRARAAGVEVLLPRP